MDQFIIGMLVANQPGVLTRVSGLISRRGFNIDSLAVGETEDPAYSRMTVTMRADNYVKEQIVRQMEKLHDVKIIREMDEAQSVCRELLLIKVAVRPEVRQDVMDAVQVFRSKIIDYATDSLCIELTGEKPKIDAFVKLMEPYGILEMCRTGIVAMERGKTAMRTVEEAGS